MYEKEWKRYSRDNSLIFFEQMKWKKRIRTSMSTLHNLGEKGHLKVLLFVIENGT